jgi:predicted hydrolase (HD superfamily)
MIDKDRALKLLDKYVSTPWLRLHMIESEAIMKSLAKYFGENEQEWGLAGLLHDLDFDYVQKDPLRHGVEIDNIFKIEGIELEEIILEL